jgi:hypothetical protein
MVAETDGCRQQQTGGTIPAEALFLEYRAAQPIALFFQSALPHGEPTWQAFKNN